tara:strand:+ start:92 stop:1258 length:1167 start_codon:yes stop_codon:yes gene_type:complete
MATKKGIWNLQQVRDKQLQDLWSFFDISTGNGELYTWGANERGTLALNDRTYRSSPTQVGSAATWSRLIRGGFNNDGSGAIKSDGTLWVWGRTDQGQLGQNDNIDYSSPVQVPGTWSGGATAPNAMIVVNTDGELWSWGSNASGFLGQSQTGNAQYSSPVQIPGTTWVDVVGGYESAGSVKTDGTLWTWGNNHRGYLGHNNRTNYSSPKQVPGTTWRIDNNTGIAGMTTRFIKTDGTLWSWGYNSYGQLGLNNTTEYSSPVQIPGTDWDSVGGSSYSAVATKTDGTLWTWGSNTSGELGQNSKVQYSSPVQIPGTNWAFGYIPNKQYVLAAKTDGTLWSWGANSGGQLGQNNRTQASSPIQIPGVWSTKFNGVGGAYNDMYGIKPIDS